jgi:hypothetical protein
MRSHCDAGAKVKHVRLPDTPDDYECTWRNPAAFTPPKDEPVSSYSLLLSHHQFSLDNVAIGKTVKYDRAANPASVTRGTF